MMKHVSGLAAAGLVCSIILSVGELRSAEIASRSEVQRDVESYAIATCLTLQKADFLKGQGDGWGSVIVNRGHGDVEDWHPLIRAVKSVVENEHLPVTQGDGKVLELPVAFCVEIIDHPEIANVIRKTIEKMTPAYGKR